MAMKETFREYKERRAAEKETRCAQKKQAREQKAQGKLEQQKARAAYEASPQFALDQTRKSANQARFMTNLPKIRSGKTGRRSTVR